MANVSPFSTPLGSMAGLNTSTSLFHDFVRPRGQLSSKFASSPFKGSPQSEAIDFIPLSYSSPINNNNNNSSNRSQNGNNQWRGNNRKSFGGSSNSSFNSSYSPYNTNRNQFRKSPANSSFNSSVGSYHDMDRKNFSNKKRGNNFFVNPGHSDNINLYYHPSMLEDPWADLEQKLQTRMADQNCSLGRKDAVEKSVSNLSSVDSFLSLSDSDEGADSQETDSTISVSDGSS